jgi:hypothetical protein
VRPCAHLLGHEAKNAYPSGNRLDIHICTQQGCHVPKSLVREIRPHHGNASRKVNEKKVSALTEKYTENIYENWKYLLCTKRPQEPAYEELPVVATGWVGGRAKMLLIGSFKMMRLSLTDRLRKNHVFQRIFSLPLTFTLRQTSWGNVPWTTP